ncbi:MAG: serine/threonine protein kinase, partial [Deltaproteobacteria bacterium]|nr:serine/threonine protein kinase [Deltaproteobacteria bacterium]
MNSPPVQKKRKKKDPLVGEVVGGRYQLLQRLASGGMGSVYAGRAVGAGGFERRLAIKLLHEHLAEREKFVSMFLDEARLAAKIHHPNVVSTIDVFEYDDRYFLVMEYVDGLELGRLLHAALTQGEKLPVRVVMRIVLDALAGLVAAHELTDKRGKALNLVHRDVSPQNILVGADGISRLTDFGVAKAEDRIHVTQGLEFKGKVAYAAPEQLEHSIVEQRSDVFAMGIILWETLAQKRLFKAKDKHGVRRMILAGGYPTLSSIDPTLFPFDQLVEEAMAQDINKRTVSAAELMRQVEEVAATIGGPASPKD